MYRRKRIQSKVEGRLYRYCPKIYKRIKAFQLKENKYCRKVTNIINISAINISEIRRREYQRIIKYYLNHQFDILGSGWKSFNLNEHSVGIYKNIEWNKDFRSGYIWYKENNSVSEYTNPDGSDIKNVWEIGRLQHLLRLALCYLDGFEEKYIIEFYNLTKDFMENNPAGEGIQWTCSMEVAIRAVNMLLAYDIFAQCDTQNIFDNDYKNAFSLFIYRHGKFIINNLEFIKGSKINHNHYYCDILGLLYISSYLKNNKWYCFAKTEFEKETQNQFLADGADMEGSTCYHKLCTEILQLGIAVILHNEGKCRDELLMILQKATNYLETIMLPNGEIPQIGDNDSATILKISYKGYEIHETIHKFYGYEQNYNESRESTRNSYGIISRSLALGIQVKENIKISNMEYSFIKSLVGTYNYKYRQPNNHSKRNFECTIEYDYPQIYEKTTEFNGIALKKNASGWMTFDNIGIYVYKSDNLYLCFNIGKEENKKFMGHVHDDVLHVELYINGKVILEDPGTLTYTANETLRNSFRNYEKHFIPIYEGKMDITSTEPFNYERKCKATVVSKTENSIHAIKYYGNIVHHRIIIIDDYKVQIIDKSDVKFRLPKLQNNYWFSDNYGSVIEKYKKA